MIEPNYLPFILIGGGIIFVVLFFHYVPFFLWLSAKVFGGTHLIGAIILKCASVMSLLMSLSRQ